MGAYTLGIFVATSDQKLKAAAKSQWKFAKVRKMEHPYSGWAILGYDIKHAEDEDLTTGENDRFKDELPAFSRAFPEAKFVLMEEDEHGDLSSYQGIVFQNGETLLDEWGDESFVLTKYAKELEAGTEDYYSLYDQRMNRLLFHLGIIEEDGYFEPFQYGYFDIPDLFTEPESEHFSAVLAEIDAPELLRLKDFPNLRSASFSGSDLDDEGLRVLSEITRIENLSLQETEITSEGLIHLKALPNLVSLRLKDNPQLTNTCMESLVQLEKLEELQIHETAIDRQGTDKLVNMPRLKRLVLDIQDDNFSYESLQQLSEQIPACEITVKGKGTFINGKFSGSWNH